MKKWLQNFMTGRYGSDELSFVILVLYLAFCIISVFADIPLLQLFATGLIIWSFYRILSHNIPARKAENDAYLRFLANLYRKKRARKARRQDKEHRYYRCKRCGTVMRVPKGVGKIEITCPKCGEKIRKKV